MEFYNINWRQTAWAQSVEVPTPVAVSFLYLWSCYLRGFPPISRSSYLTQQKILSWCTLFYFCLFRIKKFARLFWILTVFEFFPRSFRSSPLFTATCKNSPSTRSVSAGNILCKDVNMFGKTITFLKQILC